jgi:hypothetical protein
MADPPSPLPVVDAPKLSETERRFVELGQTLWNDNTDKGKLFRQAAKEKFPDAVTIEDQLDPIVAPLRDEARALRDELKAERERREEDAKKAEEDRATLTLQQRVEHAVSSNHLTDEGRELMLQRMRDTGNFSDPLAAAAYIIQTNPPPKDPTGYLGPQAINLFGSAVESAEERIKLLHADPMGKFLDAEFTDFIRDPDQYIRDAGFAA